MISCPVCLREICWEDVPMWLFDSCPCGRLACGISGGNGELRWEFTRLRNGEDELASRMVVHRLHDGSLADPWAEDDVRRAVEEAEAEEVLGS